MSPTDQNIAIAEWCGLKLFVLHKPIHDPFGYYRENAHGYTGNLSEAWRVTEEVARKYTTDRPTDPDRVVAEPAPIPNYHGDLNTVHEAESKLMDDDVDVFESHLDAILSRRCRVCDASLYPSDKAWHCTAPQRCEALLRTIGKWKDE